VWRSGRGSARVGAPSSLTFEGHGGTFWHPTAFALDALAAGSSVWRTDRNGTIGVTFVDGVAVVSGER
jgi:beta-lactamase superfamily II metal-dependent hydrolase